MYNNYNWIRNLGNGWAVYLLKDGDREGRGLSSSGLSLSNDVMAFDAGHNGALLDCGRLLETVRVNASKQLLPTID